MMGEGLTDLPLYSSLLSFTPSLIKEANPLSIHPFHLFNETHTEGPFLPFSWKVSLERGKNCSKFSELMKTRDFQFI